VGEAHVHRRYIETALVALSCAQLNCRGTLCA
jgi:hypothetical protein